MNFPHPIYTEKTECQDCYKCLRQCPVKAIKIVDGVAEIIPELCILCGHCVDTCPVEAKKIRDDLSLLDHLLSSPNKTFASIAPSFVSEFSGIHYSEMIRALKEVGFDAVSETALGAQEVSAHIGNKLDSIDEQIIKISSACPTIVQYIHKYKPEYSQFISKLYSPLMAHGKILREQFGNDIKIIFIGPCISKKHEVDENQNIIDAAITFEELRRFFNQKKVVLNNGKISEENHFVPEMAGEGRRRDQVPHDHRRDRDR